MISIEEEQRLTALRERIGTYMSGKRLAHTLGVEREIAVLAGIYAPEEEYMLRTAALLHDITKELSREEQLQLCDESGIIYTDEEKHMPKTFHSRTAAVRIRRDFPEFADAALIDVIRWHTTGRAGMTIGDKLLYLADYIEDTRTFPDCVELRRRFYEGLAGAKDEQSRAVHLCDILILSFDMTIRGLLEDGTPIHMDTVAARNDLICTRPRA
jgi:nicotinate-nucleotide adenylyltransferase